MWNGSPDQLDALFRQRTSTTYPLLLEGSQVGQAFGFIRDRVAVIDHEGILRYRQTTFLTSDSPVIETIEASLAAIPEPAPPPTAVEQHLWGWIKRIRASRLAPPAANPTPDRLNN
ncbi:MAG: hypothetical protein GKR89_29965 [Candidatus Latescibacteria bacterium]|nr:hypothetical protein [Candidatus Latescibacterota bacterium]